MTNNLQLYHKTVQQLCQWLPDERITRLRNMALLLVGLQQARGIQTVFKKLDYKLLRLNKK